MSVLNDVHVIPEIALYDPLREINNKKSGLKPGGGKPVARR